MTKKFIAFHEKSIAILEMIEGCDTRLGGRIHSHKYMVREFGIFYSGSKKAEHDIEILKAAKRRLINYYANHVTKHNAMIELGKVLNNITNPENIAA